MTRVFFDVSALPEVGKAVTGISRVLLCVLRHLARAHPELEIAGISFRDTTGGHRLWRLSDIVQQASSHLTDVPYKSGAAGPHPPAAGDCILLLGEQWLFPACLPEVRRLRQERGVKVISLVHDLVPFFMPELYWDGFPEAYIACLNELVAVSDGILVYSESTRKDLLKYLPQTTARVDSIHLVRLGDRFDFPLDGIAQPPQEKVLVAGSYILCVGTIQPRKNHLLLLAVWRRLSELYGSSCPTLLLVGQPGWHVGDLLYFLTHHPALKQKVRILEQVTDSELQWLYANCWFSIYPSLYEGWGLPIAESMALGKLCLASESSAMPEVAGQFAEYFSPYDSGDLLRRIERYIREPALVKQREELIRKGFKPTSWAETANQFSQAIGKVLARKW
jgi:glycosyltransferase involved in cell wall biosynthesis